MSLFAPRKSIGGAEVQLHSFLTSVIDGCEWSTLCLGKNHGTHWIGGGVGPKNNLDVVKQRKIYCHCRNSNPGSSSLQPSHHTDYSIASQESIRFNRQKNTDIQPIDFNKFLPAYVLYTWKCA